MTLGRFANQFADRRRARGRWVSRLRSGAGLLGVALVASMVAALVNPLRAASDDGTMTLDDLEIHGELLAPRALFIVGGQTAEAEAGASVLDYIAQLDDEPRALELILVLSPIVVHGTDEHETAVPSVPGH